MRARSVVPAVAAACLALAGSLVAVPGAVAVSPAAVSAATVDTATADATADTTADAKPGKPPKITITSPRTTTTVVGAVTVTGRASDDHGLDGDQVYVYLQPRTTAGGCGPAAAYTTTPVVDGEWTTTFASGSAPDGTYCVAAIAMDTAGQQTYTSRQWLMLSDGSPRLVNLSARSQCDANGVASVAVYAVNGEQVPVDVRMTTPYGEKKVTSLAPGKAAYVFTQSGEPKVAKGTATVSAYYWDGVGHHETYTLPYAKVRC
ncbi:Ig-like domain-containing protein [Cellulomonas sp. PhB143]|uniref:Ig-like domain-containing protein n=1 Tax=Cellulomonas sp. PhB143 TaxID=2485186 RepID=UPI000F4A7EA5|nr:Ig-like domain-containing protein [Cellulomonas sp. PhB143]ROS79168.1 hypothetical protein EDF32_0050 [Cellulomonas sp. PhB143]